MSFPIVGQHFHPPAKVLLSLLRSETPLIARPEPSNPYDPNAIAVWLRSADIPPELHDRLDAECAGFGLDADTIYATSEWHLGYVPAKLAAVLISDFSGEKVGKLVFSLAGKAEIEWPKGDQS
jgi:hypothetical protein